MRKFDYSILLFWALRLTRLIGRIAPERLLRGIGYGAATAVFAVLPGKRENIRRNLRVILKQSSVKTSREHERRVRRLARKCMRTYGQIMLDFVAFDRLLPMVWRDTEVTTGWEHIDRAVADGRGVVFVTAHFGHWDMAGAALARHVPCKVYAVAESFSHRDLNRLVIEQRASYGMEIVPMDDVRRMRRVLRDGNILGILADRPAQTGEGVAVTFFGRETRFPAGAATLASLAKCPIIVGALHRAGNGRFAGIILPPIQPLRTGNREHDIANTMQAVVHDLETIICRSPHHWFMFRDMWPRANEFQCANPGMQVRSKVVDLGMKLRATARTRTRLPRSGRRILSNRPKQWSAKVQQELAPIHGSAAVLA